MALGHGPHLPRPTVHILVVRHVDAAVGHLDLLRVRTAAVRHVKGHSKTNIGRQHRQRGHTGRDHKKGHRAFSLLILFLLHAVAEPLDIFPHFLPGYAKTGIIFQRQRGSGRVAADLH